MNNRLVILGERTNRSPGISIIQPEIEYNGLEEGSGPIREE